MSVDHRDVKRVLRLHERLDRLWADDRFTAAQNGQAIRALAEALIWGAFHRVPADEYGEWLETKLGKRSPHNGDFHGAIGADAPRYEPPDTRWSTPCPVSLTRGPRRGTPCNRHSYSSTRVTDPATGQWRMVGYCNAHAAYLEAARIAEKVRLDAGGIPEPLPNRGGLLPCHTTIRNWPTLYAQSHYGWKPPRVGIRADDWPVMAQVAAAEPPKLVLLRGKGQQCEHQDMIDLGRSLYGRPAPLTLVPGRDDDEPDTDT